MAPFDLTGDDSLAVRTDFTDDAAWQAVRAAITAPYGPDDFRAYLQCVDDAEYDGLTVERLVELCAGEDGPGYAFLVDHRSITDPEMPVLVVDLYDEPGRTFRVIPAELHAVENNLSIANMDYEEFHDSAGADGVFRGFPGMPGDVEVSKVMRSGPATS